jgi:hypothetical protein
MAAIHVAQARKGDRVKTINHAISNLEKQVTQGTFSPAGSYARSHADWCRQEIGNLKAEIERIAGLADDALIAEFAPEVAREAAIEADIAENGPVEFDPLGRGAMAPKGVVVSKTPPPVRREGGDPAPVAPGLTGALPQGVVFGYDENYNVVPLKNQ